MSFVRNAASVLFTGIVTTPVGIAVSVLLARFLSVADRGEYAVLMNFSVAAMAVGLLGWPSAAVYRMRRAGADPRRVFAGSLGATLVVSALLVGLGLLLRAPISGFLGGVSPTAYLLALALIPLELLANQMLGLARGLERFDLDNWYRFLRPALILAGLGAVLVAYPGALVEALAAVLCVYAILGLGVTVAVLRLTGTALVPGVDEVRETLRFGLKSYAQRLAVRLHERVDLFLLAYLLANDTEIAYYAVAVSVLRRIRLVPQSLARVLYPRLAGSEETRAAHFTAEVSRHSTLWVVLSVVALGGAAPVLMPLLYGEPYHASILPFLVLLPGMACLTLFNVLSRYFLALNRQRINVLSQVLAVLLNVGLNLLLIPEYGILGAAASSTISYTAETVLITGAFLRHSGERLRDVVVVGRRDLAHYPARVRPWLRRLRSSA